MEGGGLEGFMFRLLLAGNLGWITVSYKNNNNKKINKTIKKRGRPNLITMSKGF
jgi:hypothetical protein